MIITSKTCLKPSPLYPCQVTVDSGIGFPQVPLSSTPSPPTSAYRSLHCFLAEPGMRLQVLNNVLCLCLGDRVGVCGHMCSYLWGQMRERGWPSLCLSGAHRVSSWAPVSPCGSKWTGPWDQIFEPSLLTCAPLRKPLAQRLGPGLNL